MTIKIDKKIKSYSVQKPEDRDARPPPRAAAQLPHCWTTPSRWLHIIHA
jgi:hypothetical protein